jgi:asparagine synthase (glutamine-hydrolysing)
MCGIAGYVAGGGSRAVLERMAGAIVHRGPDDAGFYETGTVGFAFRRLSIVDVAGGHQPLSNETGSVWVIMNGEVYGYKTMRLALQAAGHGFRTESDTEILVHAYEEWGDEFLARMNGMFAIALWDEARQCLILARDRMGEKPLYWTRTKQGGIAFASEIKALLAGGFLSRRSLSQAALTQYLCADSVWTPHSIFEGIYKVPPGTALLWTEATGVQMKPFWGVANCLAPVPKEKDRVLRGLRERIDASVAERLVADVPVGIFLSGGIDSAIIAESASRQMQNSLDAFTIRFEDSTHDETPAAHALAQQFGFRHHIQTCNAKEAMAMLNTMEHVYDEPIADPSILPMLLLAERTHRHVKVALSGDGGDELLLGYQHVPLHQAFNLYPKALPRLLRATAPLLERTLAKDGYFSLGFKAQRLARGAMWNNAFLRDLAWRGSWTWPDAQKLLCGMAVPFSEGIDPDLQALLHDLPVGAFWRQWSWIYLRTFLMDQVLVKVDRATMRFGLESRAPLLDPRVVEWLFATPDEWKLNDWKEKRLFKELLQRRVPDIILKRSKHGFAPPMATWLRGPLRDELRQSFIDARATDLNGRVDLVYLSQIEDEHFSRKRDRRKELWSWLVLWRWAKHWLLV